ncbi:MAG: STAS domain-containing protein, partial [Anaerohalosphaeraceae bacterium]
MSAIEVQKKDDGALIILTGRLDTECVGRNWSAVFQQFKRSAPDKIIVDASALKDLDGAGIAFLLSIQRTQEDSKRSFEIIHLKP